MASDNRESGINIVGDIPWGTHFCQFYDTPEDLISILVPYFKAGLENNEFCMWVTAEPLVEEHAKEAMRKAMPDFDLYLEKGQIEIVPHDQWYLKGGVFDLQKVLDGWIDKLDHALKQGYDGLRVTGNTAWLEKKDWKSFTGYEAEINKIIGNYRMIAICTYSLDRCGAAEVIDVVSNHQFALIRQRGKWRMMESTERKQIEESLRESEEKLRLMFEALSLGINVSDLNYRIVQVNDTKVRMHGYESKDELIGRSVLELLVEEDRSRAMYFRKQRLEHGYREGTEYTYLRKDGSKFPGEASNAVLKDASGNPTGFITITKDITERKETEAALKRSEERYRTLIATSPDGIAMLGTDGLIAFASKKIVELFGFENDNEIIGKSPIEWIATEDRKRARTNIGKIAVGAYTGQNEYRMVKKDGASFWGEINSSVIKDSEGNRVGMIAVIRDITERKQQGKVREFTRRLLEIANLGKQLNPTLKEFVQIIGNYAGCDAVGIRILDSEGNIPYQAYEGFSREFYESESPLSIKLHQCMCINVIKGDTDFSLPYYTEDGSFYMNGTTAFLATVSEEEKGSTRNVCNQQGYESVALVPIRLGDSILGLIHIADKRTDMVPLGLVNALEDAAPQIGLSIRRLWIEHEQQ